MTIIIQMNVCCACSKAFSSASTVRRHEKNHCLVIKRQKTESEIHQLKETIMILEDENQRLAKRIQELEKEVYESKLSYEKERRIHAENRMEQFDKHLREVNKKPRYNTNTIINNLAPFTLTQERAIKIAEQYTTEDFLKGTKGTMDFIKSKQLSNEDGELMIVCTDLARRIFKGMMPDGSSFTDYGGAELTDIIAKSIRPVITKTYKTLDIIDAIDPILDHKAQKRLTQPARLSKELATITILD